MNREIVSDRIGTLSGLFYVLLMGIGIPLLVLNDPSFSTDFNQFDPLSKLSQTDSSKVYYRLMHIFAGILALLYFELHFFPSRKMYQILNNWRLSKLSARIGFYGQISTGIFERDLFPIHLFAVAAYVAGYVSCFVFISFNLDNQLVQKDKIRILIILGYVISILILMNALYFRYSSIRGIWQFFIIIIGICWYILELIFYRSNSSFLEKNLVMHSETSEIRAISHVMIGFGIYLIIFGLLLQFRPSMWPWRCGENDETCQLPNVLSLIISGIVLTLFSLSYQFQMRRNTIKSSIL